MKKKKKWPVVLCVILALLICIFIAGYFIINAVFSMFSESFYQSVIDSGDFVQSSTNTDVLGNETSAEPTVGGGAEQTQGKPSGDDGILRKIPYEKIKNLTPEEFKALEQKILFSDKVAVLNILSMNLSSAEYQEIVGLVNGGITKEEIKRAHQILSKSLSSENKQKIWGYYDKYIYLIQ